MARICLFFALALCLCPVLSAKEIAVGPQGVSPFLDTEVSTNVSFNVSRNDEKAFDVRIELASSVSNCVQIAFGRDADGDGDLAPEETGLVLGWRAGRYFVEDVAGEARHFEPEDVSDGGSRFLHLNVATDAAFVPKRASFGSGAGACFAEIAAASPPWLFSAEWNLLKVTRRGAAPAGELCRIRNDCRFFRVVFR
ncbi:MAG: hypothetical protein ACI4Q3_01180 [Kiritimatiellia bacterium]